MYFASLHDLIFMNGHGVYVWGAYGISFFTLITLVWHAVSRHTKLRKEIAQSTQD
jgi:heme exporter protein D